MVHVTDFNLENTGKAGFCLVIVMHKGRNLSGGGGGGFKGSLVGAVLLKPFDSDPL